MILVVPAAVRLNHVVPLAEAIEILYEFRWAQLRQIRKEPVRVDDNTAMYEKPETYQEYQTI